MSIEGIPNLSKENIEEKVNSIFSLFKNDFLFTPQPTPILEFANFLHETFGVQFVFDKDLGSRSGKKVLGLFNVNPSIIFVAPHIVNDEYHRFKFILAHELGHFVFHRKLRFDQDDYDIFFETEVNYATGKKILKTDKDWLEWQANYFASCFLLPRATFKNALIEVQNEIGITRNLGIIYLDKSNYSLRDFNRTIIELSKTYMVNKLNIQYRLSELNLVEDRRKPERVRNVGEILSDLNL